MSDAPFVTSLRSRPTMVRLVPETTPSIAIRVEMPEVWDVVSLAVEPATPVLTVKTRALEVLYPEARTHTEFVVKFRGWDILDESASLADVGVVDGSILLLTFRHRRPVR